jgi:abnormal spindle-like microcephaly-associated protein
LIRSWYERTTEAASKLQRVWRGYVAFCDYGSKLLAVFEIQKVIRSFFAKQRVRQLRLEVLAFRLLSVRRSIVIQRCVRQYWHAKQRHAAAAVIQRRARGYLLRMSASKIRRRVVLLQSRVRGHHVRRRRSLSVSSQALRIQRANEKAEKDPRQRLCVRAKDALDFLLRVHRLSVLHAAICTLEITTRLSEACCTSVVEAGACWALFTHVNNCNRSLPHLEILQNILQILVNICQYDELRPIMATTKGVEILLNRIQIFRDHDEIFYRASWLLERLVDCDRDLEVGSRDGSISVFGP